jgi:polar amino acid transport system substrate-binding protein
MRIDFCDPYSRTGQMAVVRRGDTQRFRGGFYAIAQTPTIGAVENTTGAGLVRSKYEKARKQFFNTAAEGIDALRRGDIDFMIHDAAVVMVLAAQYESELEPVYSLLTEEYLAWGVRRGDEALRQAANAYMADLKRDGRLEALVKRWMPF